MTHRKVQDAHMEVVMNRKVHNTSNEEAALPAPLNDCTPEEAAEARYLEAMANLMADATAGKHMHILADNIAWTIASISVNCGVGAAGDILRKIGGYICTIETRCQAQEEAQQAKQEGRLAH